MFSLLFIFDRNRPSFLKPFPLLCVPTTRLDRIRSCLAWKEEENTKFRWNPTKDVLYFWASPGFLFESLQEVGKISRLAQSSPQIFVSINPKALGQPRFPGVLPFQPLGQGVPGRLTLHRLISFDLIWCASV